MELTTSDGNTLEAQWDHAEFPRAVAVFCHPHPLQGGTMTAPLMEKVTAYLLASEISVLRFNFRGVGRSTGQHDFGISEQLDITAGADAAASLHPELPHGICGWSFGAATSLIWKAGSTNTWPWVGIAPPVASDRAPQLPETTPPGRITFILGDQDQFTTPEALTQYAALLGGHVEILPGSDHFFYFREDEIGALVVKGLFGTET